MVAEPLLTLTAPLCLEKADLTSRLPENPFVAVPVVMVILPPRLAAAPASTETFAPRSPEARPAAIRMEPAVLPEPLDMTTLPADPEKASPD